jgi:heterodisulfide reductase subunit A
MQASGAAACVGEILGDVRGSMITKKEYPQEIDVSGLPPRIGVFVCRCGINIAAVVDVPAVTEYAKTLPNVVCVEEKIYLCSQDAQSLIKEKIKEHDLNRVVVASCTPRTHERLFQDTIREAGLNKYLFEMANIRDQCSWVHGKEPDSATQKAKELVKMSVARAGLLEPLQHTTMEITHKALVIGGGLSGMTAALSLSEQGFEVHIVEKEKELGGNLRYVYFTLDGSDVQAYLKSLIQKVKSHHLIKLHLSSQLTKISGHVGYFKSEIRNPKSEITIEHGIVIVATGGVESKPTEYLYGQDDRILTQRQLEEQIVNPKSEIRNPKSIVMIQCVGSRDDERPYCSRICCSQAVKNALKLKEKNPDIQVYILYRDMRTYGFREDYYSLAREAGVIFIRYDLDTKPVVTNHGPLKVRVKEPVLGEEIVLSPDIVVLAPAIVPHPENEKLASLMKVTLNAERFFLEAHLKLRPVDFAIEGMFLCGLAHSPKDISESIAQAQAAAGRAATILAKDHLEVGGVISTIDEDKCVACLTCIRMCPYDVPFINTKGAAEIESAKCQGCGICAAECPAKAIQLMHYKDNQLLAKTEALFA